MKKYIYVVIVSIVIAAIILISIVIFNFNKEKIETMKIKSIFAEGGKIPQKYTCDGLNVNPILEFNDIPNGTKSLVLIIDDPDAPAKVWVHWVVWNISPATTKIEEDSFPSGAIQGINDFGENNYGGMCPPSGTHRYKFKIYALDTTLNLSPNSQKGDVERAMKNHILAQAVLTGLYSRG